MAGHLLPGPHPALVPARPDAAGPPVTLGDAVLQARGLPPEPPPLNHALEPAADAEMGGERKRNSKMCLNVFHGPLVRSEVPRSSTLPPSTLRVFKKDGDSISFTVKCCPCHLPRIMFRFDRKAC